MTVKSSDKNIDVAKTGSSTFKTETSLSHRFNTTVSIQNLLNSV